jgi:hypothetical protein
MCAGNVRTNAAIPISPRAHVSPVHLQAVADNPFAVLTAVVAPAILTNASSVLALGTSNRLGRVVDRTRIVANEIAATDPTSVEYRGWSNQLAALEQRAEWLIRALRCFYVALGLFAAAALVSVAGSIAAYYGVEIAFRVAAGLAIATGATAVGGLSLGCTRMVQETRLAVHFLNEEAKLRISMRGSKPAP